MINKAKQLEFLASYPFAQYIFLGFFTGRIEEVLNRTELFFIVGMGRSGTKFLSLLLNKNPVYSVYHEFQLDRDALVEAYRNPDVASRYIESRRARIIAARILRNKPRVYGEVNSYLRYHIDPIRSLWNPAILHLVRDGREVVQSLMNRNSFTGRDKDHTGRISPKEEDPFASVWFDMDRFSRICWYWSTTNEYLMKRNLPIVRLEDIISSYDQFELQVLQPLRLDLSYDIWCKEVIIPKNVSKDDDFPYWLEWKDEQKRKFKLICGDTMVRLGYEI